MNRCVMDRVCCRFELEAPGMASAWLFRPVWTVRDAPGMASAWLAGPVWRPFEAPVAWLELELGLCAVRCEALERADDGEGDE